LLAAKAITTAQEVAKSLKQTSSKQESDSDFSYTCDLIQG
jgi:hypothetical protein